MSRFSTLIQNRRDSGATETRSDSPWVYTLPERELEKTETQVQEIEYPNYLFANGDVVPLEVTNEPFIETVKYTQSDKIGFFKLIRNYSTDVPIVESVYREVNKPVFDFAGKYVITDKEMEFMRAGNGGVESRKVEAVTEASEQSLNSMIATGLLPDGSSSGFDGFINHPDFNHSFAPYGINSASTATQILTLLNDSANVIPVNTRQVEAPNTLLLPLTQYNYMANTQVSTSRPETILQTFLANSTYIKNVFPLNELTGAGPNGTDVMIMYDRSPSRIKARIVMPLTFKGLKEVGLHYERHAKFRYGGIVPYRPFSVHVIAGI